MLRIGDKVLWRGGFGQDQPKLATVIAIEKDCVAKSGTKVNSIPWDEVNTRGVIVDLDNSHWCYGTSVTRNP